VQFLRKQKQKNEQTQAHVISEAMTAQAMYTPTNQMAIQNSQSRAENIQTKQRKYNKKTMHECM